MIATTLNAIKAAGFNEYGLKKLLKALGKTEADDEPLPLARILKTNGLSHALWVLQYALPDDRLARHYQAWAAERALPVFEARYPGDGRIRAQIAMLRNDTATAAQRHEARDAALSSWVRAHDNAGFAADEAALIVEEAASWAEDEAALDAEEAAALAVEEAAEAAEAAAWAATAERVFVAVLAAKSAGECWLPGAVSASGATAYSAERQAQAAHFLEVVSQETAAAL